MFILSPLDDMDQSFEVLSDDEGDIQVRWVNFFLGLKKQTKN